MRYQWCRDRLPVSNAGLRELITVSTRYLTVQAIQSAGLSLRSSDFVIIQNDYRRPFHRCADIHELCDRKAALVNYNLSIRHSYEQRAIACIFQ